MTDPRPTLRRARALIADPQTWTKGTAARAADGSKCNARDDTAVMFCMVGAVARSTFKPGHFTAAYHHLRDSTPGATAYGALEAWNDAKHRTHADVLHALDEAIATRPDPA